MNHQGILVVVSGFSGAGKGTWMKELLKRYDNYALSISATTRAPREGETDGKEYFFVTKEQFEKMRDEIQGTILIISHQERILDIADKIVVIANGQVKTIGTKEEVLPELLHTAGACETLTSKL